MVVAVVVALGVVVCFKETSVHLLQELVDGVVVHAVLAVYGRRAGGVWS